MNFKTILVTGAISAALTMAAAAHATVVNFDDLTGSDVVADGYGGISWGGVWAYYNADQTPYTAASGTSRIYVTGHDVGVYEAVGFKFAGQVSFDGAYFAGQFDQSVTLQMYLNGAQVAVSDTLNPTSAPTFLASGYAGAVDEVRIYGANAYYVMDDVTYSDAPATAPAPEPAAWTLMIIGFGLTGAALRGRRGAVRAA